MPIANQDSGTRIDEIADGIHRISTPIPPSDQLPPGFTFNQFLIVDDEPLLFHTGLRGMFPLLRQAIELVMPIDRLRHVSFSHVEADECGALNEVLAAAPNAAPLCGEVAAMTSIGDLADRPPRAMKDGERLSLGRHSVTWLATPHLPHGWECGYLFESTTSTLLCGDLFTRFGADHPPLTEEDILEDSEQARGGMDYYAHAPNSGEMLDRLAALEPGVLACMHGSAWRGPRAEGASLLRALAARLAA
jgi:flavorubredoxin